MDLEDVLTALCDAVRASPHNLMSPRALDELETRHVPESLALAAMLPPGPARLVDVGAGGGFPGLVIAAARPDLAVTLVESTRKKARFLEETAGALDLSTAVVNERIEDVATGRLAGAFLLATARAVAPLERLVPWVIPALAPGGRLYAVKGERWREDLEAAEEAIRRAGAAVLATPETRGSRPDDPHDADGTSTGVEPLVVIIGRRPRDR